MHVAGVLLMGELFEAPNTVEITLNLPANRSTGWSNHTKAQNPLEGVRQD